MSKRILFVEDEPGLVMTLTDRLRNEGYAVETTYDGESGLAAVGEIRQSMKKDVPAMIITADYSEKAAKEASLHGLEVMKKPVKPAEMRALLSFLLT